MNNYEINRKIEKHLDNALKLCQASNKEHLIIDWFDNNDLAEGYGYTANLLTRIGNLKRKVNDLEEELGEYEMPRIEYLEDENKMEFFFSNLNKFTLEDLESIVDSF